MASAKVIAAKLERLSSELAALRVEVLSGKPVRRKPKTDQRDAWRQLGRKVSRRWKSGTAAEEIQEQRTKGA